MKIYFFIALLAGTMSAQTDPLKQRYRASIQSIVSEADAVVAYSVMDLRSGETLHGNETELFPTASSIKLFIMAEVYRQAAAGKFSLNDVRPLSPSLQVGGSGVLSILNAKTVSMSIRDYCVLMMNMSDNTATNLLIELAGMKNINDFAAALGCTSTKLQRVMMDIQAAKEERENISTSADLLTFLNKLYRGEIVSKEASREMLAIITLDKSGPIKSGVPAGIPIASKSGEIEGTRCDAGIVYLYDAPYIIVVMTKLLSSPAEGNRIISDISKATYGYWERKANSNKYGRRIPK